MLEFWYNFRIAKNMARIDLTNRNLNDWFMYYFPKWIIAATIQILKYLITHDAQPKNP